MIEYGQSVPFTAACPDCRADATWTAVRREISASYTDIGTQSYPPLYTIECDCTP